MSKPDIADVFPRGLLRPELFLGVTASVTARMVGVNLSEAGRPSGTHFTGGRYGRGEVGEFVLVEGQQSLLLGRISEIRLREPERRSLTRDFSGDNELAALGQIQLLGCVAIDTLRVTAGVDAYPRLGDRIYAAPHSFIALLPQLMEKEELEVSSVTLALGSIDVAMESAVTIKPERLFARHCAILGATGGGKSWTTARIIEECLKHNCKLVLLDATGEYRDFKEEEYIMNCHLGEPVKTSEGSVECVLPPHSFLESDFIALFEPSGKVQGPKLKAAIESLRLVYIDESLATDGLLKKEHREKIPLLREFHRHALRIQDPSQPFAVKRLPEQLVNECVEDFDEKKYGKKSERDVGYCAALLARINGAFRSSALKCVFGDQVDTTLTDQIEEFHTGKKRLLRICLCGIGYEYKAREIIANVVGRSLLTRARQGHFQHKPTIVFVDEAHNFLGQQIGSEDHFAKLDAFELIAKEGRKYGLNVCLATQRPRDITEGVLSQMGTLIVHRLTNDRDRDVVERACGEIDRAASAFLPNLRPGEAAIIGTDFPIPLTLQIHKPAIRPQSDGADYQQRWRA